jgi:hypothetical protein
MSIMSSFFQEISGVAWQETPLAGDLDLHKGSVRIVRFGEGTEGGVALLARSGVHVRINGLPVLGGIALLQHRDEILINAERFCFSAETRPVVTTFHMEPGSRGPTCPVCRGSLADGEQAVRCPGCGRWFHQIEASEGRKARSCWTYSATCRFCQHPTSLSGETAWRPEQEEAHVDFFFADPIPPLRAKSVLIAGLGNIGSPLVAFLARLGVGELRLVDRDRVEEKNVRSQDYLPEDVGSFKTEVLAERLRRQMPDLAIESRAINLEDLPMEDASVDLVLGALDSRRARQVLISEMAWPFGVPVIDGGVGEGWRGRGEHHGCRGGALPFRRGPFGKQGDCIRSASSPPAGEPSASQCALPIRA